MCVWGWDGRSQVDKREIWEDFSLTWEWFVNWTQRMNVIQDLEEETDWDFCWKEFVYIAPSPGGNKWSGVLSNIHWTFQFWVVKVENISFQWTLPGTSRGFLAFIEYWLGRQDVGLIQWRGNFWSYQNVLSRTVRWYGMTREAGEKGWKGLSSVRTKFTTGVF